MSPMRRWTSSFLVLPVLICLVSLSPASAQPTADGDDFEVPTFLSSYQGFGAVASDPAGNFIVVWESGQNSFAYFSIMGQRFASDGSKLGSQFVVSDQTSYFGYTEIDIGLDAAGDFVVVWRSYDSPGNDIDYSIQARRLSSSGSPKGDQFQVNTDTSDQQQYPSVAVAADGSFMVVWQTGYSPTDHSDGIRGQIYASDGSPVDTEFQVNAYTTGIQERPDVTWSESDEFVVVWSSNGSPGNDSSSNSIQGQRFATDGSAVSSQFQVNSYTTSSQEYPSVDTDGEGDFVVVWHSNGSLPIDDQLSIQGQRFASDGSAVGSQFKVNTYTVDRQSRAQVSVAGDGQFVVAWQSEVSTGNDSDNESVQVQRYNSDGNASGTEFQVNTYTTDDQRYPAVAMDDDGEFIVVWQIENYSIRARRYVLSTDVSITVDDGSAQAIAGSSVIYGISVANSAGAGTGATVTADFPAELSCTWTAITAGGASGTLAGTGDLLESVTLPASSSIDYTVTCDLGSDASGSLSVTATVSPTVEDTNDANNSATDVDTIVAEADIAVTKTDGVTQAIPGQSVTYTLVVSNLGPSDTSSVTVTDLFPASLGCIWTSTPSGGASGNSNGTGDLVDAVDLSASSTVTYMAVCAIDPSATGTLSNTVTVTPTDSDPVPGNNNASDTDTVLTPEADVGISKSDAVTTAVPGQSLIYTLEAFNLGPSDAPSVDVADVFPADLTCTWTSLATGGASGNSSGAGNLAETISLPVSSSVVYTASCSIAADASGTLSNTATVTVGGGVTDGNGANNSATDADTVLGVAADISVSKTDHVTEAVPGETLSYLVVIANAGPSDAAGVTLTDTFPGELTCSWLSVAVGGATGNSSSSGFQISDTLSLPASSSVSYSVDCTIDPSATGTLSNTAVALVPVGISDPDTADQSATDDDTVLQAQADLSITKTDGITSVVPGASVTYTIDVANAGPSAVTGATVADAFPADLTGCTWTCSANPGATCTAGPVSGDIADTADLAPSSSVVYEATCTVAVSAVGTLTNTATVAAPVGVDDPETDNNSATDVDLINNEADLSISKTDNQSSAIPGQPITYLLTVANAGPRSVTGATVTDTFPSTLTGCTWTCAAAGGAACTAGPVAGNVADTVDLPVGGSALYTVSCTIDESAQSTLINSAAVAVPGGFTDPVPGNNSATDVNFLVREADLSITKTDNQETALAGEELTYIILASNAGPVAVTGATVTDVFPAVLDCSWTCSGAGGATCTAGPQSGNLVDSADLPVGAVATYVAVCDLPPDASGTLSNTATLAVPSGTTDPDTSNNSATDVDVIGRSADLSITKDNAADAVVPGTSTTYTLAVANTGPSNVVGATVSDTLPSDLTCSWTCAASAGASCTASGSGDIQDSVDLPPLATLTYTVECDVDASAQGTLSNTASITPPADIVDEQSANDSSTDSDPLTPQADLTITKNDGQSIALPLEQVTYTVEARNLGPSDASGAQVTDLFPEELLGCTWTCTPDGNATCNPGPEVDDLLDTPDLPVGDGATYTAVCSVAEPGTLQITNTASVDVPDGVSDPDPDNNSATDVDDGLLAIVFVDGFESGDTSSWDSSGFDARQDF